MRPVKVFFSGEAIAKAQAILDGHGDPDGFADQTAETALEDGTTVKVTLMSLTSSSITAHVFLQVAGHGRPYTAGKKIGSGGSALGNIEVRVPNDATIDIQICTTEVTLEVPAEQVDIAEALLEDRGVDDSPPGTQLLKWSGTFGGGYTADIALVQSGPNEVPWIDASLFLQGSDVTTLKPCAAPLLDNYPFEHDGRTFTLTLVRAQTPAPTCLATLPAPRARRPGAHGTWL